MGVITDLLKDIPLSSVLKERLADQESKMAVMEKENAILKAENSELRTSLQKIQAEQVVQGETCPYCHQHKGQLLSLAPDHTFGVLGVKVGYYKCAQCDKEWEKQQKS